MKLKLSDGRIYEVNNLSSFVPRIYTWPSPAEPDNFVLSLATKKQETKSNHMNNVLTWFYGFRVAGGPPLQSSPSNMRGILKRIYEDQPCP